MKHVKLFSFVVLLALIFLLIIPVRSFAAETDSEENDSNLIAVTYDANGGVLVNLDDGSEIAESYSGQYDENSIPQLRISYEALTVNGITGKKVNLESSAVSDSVENVRFTAQREGYILCGWQSEETGETFPENADNHSKITSEDVIGSSGNFWHTCNPTGILKAIWEPVVSITCFSDGELYQSYLVPESWGMEVCDSGIGLGSYRIHGPSKEGFGFIGWKDRTNGQSYRIGSFVQTDHDMIWDAVWGKEVTVTYESGERSFSPNTSGLMDDGTVIKSGYCGKELNVMATWFWPSDESGEYYATYWKLKGDDSGKLYAHGETYIPEENVTFEAVWKKKVTVTYSYGTDTGNPRDADNVGYYTVTRAENTKTSVNYDYGLGVGTAYPLYYKPAGEKVKIGWRLVGGKDGRIYSDLEEVYPDGDMNFYIVWDYGWNTDSIGKWYLNENDSYPVDGFYEIENKTYYLDEAGYVKTGWQQIGSTWYYFASDGAMQTGWQKVGSTWYLFNDEGEMLTGWQKVGGTWYYFKDSGTMVTGWQQVGSTWYYFKDSGAMVTGWQSVGGTWYYFKDSGAMVTGWQKVGSTWYFFKSSGAMAANEWCEGYWLNGDGSWTYQPKGSWKQDSKGWWFGDTSGWYAKNTTVKIDNVNYTFNASGYWVK